jgi:predicted PurR-regulated permease PerM
LSRIRDAGATAWAALGILALAALAGWVLWQARVVVLPVAAAGLVAAGLSPVTDRLERLGLGRGIAAAATMVTGGAVVVGIGTLVGPAMVDQLAEVGAALDDAADRFERWVGSERPFGLDATDVRTWRERIESTRPSEALDAAGVSARTGARAAGVVVTSILLVVVTTFFLLRDAARIGESIVSRSPAAARLRVRRALQGMVRSARGYLAGAATLGVVEGTAIGLALWLTGADLAVVVGLLTLVGAFVPFVGAIVVGVIAVGVALVSGGTTSAVVVAIVVVVVQQLDNELLAPVIYGRFLRLHPLAVILATAFGIEVGGFVGAFVTVPLLAASTGAWRGWARPPDDLDEDDGSRARVR